jgi:hypothetical protein
MNPSIFTGYLKDPGRLDPDAREILVEIIRKYPYCQPAQLLYAKALQGEDDIRFENRLRMASLYAGDRRLLHRLVSSPVETLGEEDRVVAAAEKETIDLASEVEQILPIAEDELLPFDFRVLGEDDRPSGRITPIFEEEVLTVETGQVPFFATDDIFLRPFAGADPPVALEVAEPKRTPADDLIDKFIRSTEPMVVRPDPSATSNRDFAEQSHREDDEFLTETLARIYVRQGYYLKAIQAYEKLSLKIPEKSVYFASQIEMVRELIKNQ